MLDRAEDINMKENIKTIEDIHKTTEGVNANLALAAQTAQAFNGKIGLNTPQTYSRATRQCRFHERQLAKITSGCKTIGEVQVKLLSRYAALTDAMRDLSQEKPSLARFEKLCRNCTLGVKKSLQWQDYSILALPAFREALQLLSDRPLTPDDEELAACDFLFSRPETDKIAMAVQPLLDALDRLCTYDLQKVKDCLSPTQIALYEMLDGMDVRSLFFEELANGRYRYLPDIWHTLFSMTDGMTQLFFRHSPDSGYSALPVEAILPREEEDLPRLLAWDCTAEEDIKSGTPELIEVQASGIFTRFREDGVPSSFQTQRKDTREMEQQHRQTPKDASRQPASQISKVCAAEFSRDGGKDLAGLLNGKDLYFEVPGPSGAAKPQNQVFLPVSPVPPSPAVAATPPRQMLELGPWTKKFVTYADEETREIGIKGRKKPLICPPKANKPWGLLVRMLTSTAADGWIELTDPYEAESWRNFFCRAGKDKKTKSAKRLAEILSFIESKNKRGERGAVCIRLRSKS